MGQKQYIAWYLKKLWTDYDKTRWISWFGDKNKAIRFWLRPGSGLSVDTTNKLFSPTEVSALPNAIPVGNGTHPWGLKPICAVAFTRPVTPNGSNLSIFDDPFNSCFGCFTLNRKLIGRAWWLWIWHFRRRVRLIDCSTKMVDAYCFFRL